MTVRVPHVHQYNLEDFFKTSRASGDETVQKAREQAKEENLLVHVVVLAHGDDGSRLASTLGTLDMLNRHVRTEHICIWLSYQGKVEPLALRKYRSVRNIDNLYDGLGGAPAIPSIPTIGKTENILHALAALHARFPRNPYKQFVIFLDNDYQMYDPINVHSLYVPWVMNIRNGKTTAREHIYIKAGGVRLRLKTTHNLGHTTEPVREPLTFLELCHEALRQAQHSPQALDKVTSLLPTRRNLEAKLGPQAALELETALDLVTTPGGRSSRGLSSYLHAHRDNPVARYLSEFTFLLHGDQGTSLANWMSMHLSSGYGLELSFLMNAAEDGANEIINIIGLPHAHHPKNDTDNFKLGIEMFTLLREIVEGTSYACFDDSWHYSSPSALGYQNCKLTGIENPVRYPPLNTLLGENV